MEAAALFNSSLAPEQLTRLFRSVRLASHALVAPLSDADATVQSMPEASPAKWHLAHTTWFFECMVLVPYLAEYRAFDEHFGFLFNSYYESIGARHARPKRGILTRPSLDSVYAYRHHVDVGVERLLQRQPSATVTQLVELGCHHEQQHQELLLTDILHLFAQNPLKPAYKPPEPLPFEAQALEPAGYLSFEGGTIEVGHEGGGFAFDCEGPRHHVFVEPYRLADRLVSNREWLEFMGNGGYQNPLLWLAEGWTEVCLQGWTMPLYWERRDDTYWTMTLRGSQPVDLDAPVTHVSYFEADAYATWSCRRLPSEAEWEHAAQGRSLDGNFADSGRLRPKRMSSHRDGIGQLFGDVWEWTRSAFQPYPRFRAAAGAVGEYNGKFMSGQFVLRGGSCVTPAGHLRASYRNFFPPATRWQFSGVRLAEDAETPLSGRGRPRPLRDSFRADVLFGLGQLNKTLPSRWLYDVQGSELFEEITRLPEYYPTRTETGILNSFSGEIAEFCGEDAVVLEYGAGAAVKTELLIQALHRPRLYVPIDIAGDFLQHTVSRFRERFATLDTSPLTADFTNDFVLPHWVPRARRVAFFPGSTIGNLSAAEAAAFLRRVRHHVGPEGRALIGVDLCNAVATLIPAYNDAAGTTARFNLNLLARINRELGGDFVLERFQHQVRWNQAEAAIEMHLVSVTEQVATVAGVEFEFAERESIHTESSRKYAVSNFAAAAAGQGWRLERLWTDANRLFGIFGLVSP